MEETKMKRFYGKHLHKYMGDTQPEITGNETGTSGTFVSLNTTKFRRNSRSVTTAPVGPRNENQELLKKLENLHKKVDKQKKANDGIFK